MNCPQKCDKRWKIKNTNFPSNNNNKIEFFPALCDDSSSDDSPRAF